MSYYVSPHGLLVHDQADWPCAACHPDATSDRQAWYLCVTCAQEMLAAASAGMSGARALMDDVTDALGFFQVNGQIHAAHMN